jgi:hypothetical protein
MQRARGVHREIFARHRLVADSTLNNDSNKLIPWLRELLADKAKMRMAPPILRGYVSRQEASIATSLIS